MQGLMFYVIGAMKAGTTWLHRNLSKHPEFNLPRVKEMHFYDSLAASGEAKNAQNFERQLSRQIGQPKELWKSLKPLIVNVMRRNPEELQYNWLWNFRQPTDGWYRRYFEFHLTRGISGDITPRYAILDSAEVLRMHRNFPGAKVIYLWRDPIERTWSQWRMMAKTKGWAEKKSLDLQTFTNLAPNYKALPHGHYAENAERFKVYFGGQMRVYFQDDIESRPREVLESISSWLGASPKAHHFTEAKKRVFQGMPMELPREQREYLKALFKKSMRNLAESHGGHCQAWYHRYWPEEMEAPAEKPLFLPV